MDAYPVITSEHWLQIFNLIEYIDDISYIIFLVSHCIIADIIQALEFHGSTCPQLVINGLVAIHRLAFVSAVSLQLGECGIFECISRYCLTLHINNATIAEWSFRAIRNLSASGATFPLLFFIKLINKSHRWSRFPLKSEIMIYFLNLY